MNICWKYLKVILLGTIICGAIIFCGCSNDDDVIDQRTEYQLHGEDYANNYLARTNTLEEYFTSAYKSGEKSTELSEINDIQAEICNAHEQNDYSNLTDVSGRINKLYQESGINKLEIIANSTEERVKKDAASLSIEELMQLQQSFSQIKNMEKFDSNQLAIEFLKQNDNYTKFNNTVEFNYERNSYTAYVVVGGVILAQDAAGNMVIIDRAAANVDEVLDAEGVSKYNLEPFSHINGVDKTLEYIPAPAASVTISENYDDITIQKGVTNIIHITGNANVVNVNTDATVIIGGYVKTVYAHDGDIIVANRVENVIKSPGTNVIIQGDGIVGSTQEADKNPIEEKKDEVISNNVVNEVPPAVVSVLTCTCPDGEHETCSSPSSCGCPLGHEPD